MKYQPFSMDQHRLRGGGEGDPAVIVTRHPSRSESSSTETSGLGLHHGRVEALPPTESVIEREEQDRESVSTTSSFDVAQYNTYLRNAQANQPQPHQQQQQQQFPQGQSQQQIHHQWSAEGHGSSSRGTTTSSTSEDLHRILPHEGRAQAYQQQPVQQAPTHPYVPSATYAQSMQHVSESHSRGSHHGSLPLQNAPQPHPQQQQQPRHRQQPTREYSVSDSLTSSGSGASFNAYSPLPGAEDAAEYVSRKGKGREISKGADGGGESNFHSRCRL